MQYEANMDINFTKNQLISTSLQWRTLFVQTIKLTLYYIVFLYEWFTQAACFENCGVVSVFAFSIPFAWQKVNDATNKATFWCVETLDGALVDVRKRVYLYGISMTHRGPHVTSAPVRSKLREVWSNI